MGGYSTCEGGGVGMPLCTLYAATFNRIGGKGASVPGAADGTVTSARHAGVWQRRDRDSGRAYKQDPGKHIDRGEAEGTSSCRPWLGPIPQPARGITTSSSEPSFPQTASSVIYGLATPIAVPGTRNGGPTRPATVESPAANPHCSNPILDPVLGIDYYDPSEL